MTDCMTRLLCSILRQPNVRLKVKSQKPKLLVSKHGGTGKSSQVALIRLDSELKVLAELFIIHRLLDLSDSVPVPTDLLNGDLCKVVVLAFFALAFARAPQTTTLHRPP